MLMVLMAGGGVLCIVAGALAMVSAALPDFGHGQRSGVPALAFGAALIIAGIALVFAAGGS